MTTNSPLVTGRNRKVIWHRLVAVLGAILLALASVFHADSEQAVAALI
jgi:hypothetical protein